MQIFKKKKEKKKSKLLQEDELWRLQFEADIHERTHSHFLISVAQLSWTMFCSVSTLKTISNPKL